MSTSRFRPRMFLMPAQADAWILPFRADRSVSSGTAAAQLTADQIDRLPTNCQPIDGGALQSCRAAYRVHLPSPMRRRLAALPLVLFPEPHWRIQ